MLPRISILVLLSLLTASLTLSCTLQPELTPLDYCYKFVENSDKKSKIKWQVPPVTKWLSHNEWDKHR